MKLNPNLPDLLCGVYVKNIVECTDTESFLLWKENKDDNNAYKLAKEDYIKEVTKQHEGLVCDRVYNSLMNWVVEFDD